MVTMGLRIAQLHKSFDVLLIGSKQRHGFGEQLLHGVSPRPAAKDPFARMATTGFGHIKAYTDALPETKARLPPRQRR